MKHWSLSVSIILLIITSFINIIQSGRQLAKEYQMPRTPLHSLAYPFIPLMPMTANIPTISYLTDKNIDDPQVLARFQLAQFILAPSLILLNDYQYPLALIDAQNPTLMINQLERHGYQPAGVLADSILVAVKKP